MYQHPLFDLEEISDRPLRRHELFFSVLDLSTLNKGACVGRKPVSIVAMLKALIFKSYCQLQKVRTSLVKKFIKLKVITGEYLSVDSCPILANVKENNLITSVRYRFLKDRPPNNDKDCHIGVFSTFVSGKKSLSSSGYRNHNINDCLLELFPY